MTEPNDDDVRQARRLSSQIKHERLAAGKDVNCFTTTQDAEAAHARTIAALRIAREAMKHMAKWPCQCGIKKGLRICASCMSQDALAATEAHDAE